MKAFLDTSVLVPVFYDFHEHHAPCFRLLKRYARHEAAMAAHSLAEIYASLTAMPGKYRVTADEAMLFLQSLRERLSIVTLNAEEYGTAIDMACKASVTSGGVYDALIAACALKAKAETLYSWNLRDFNRFPQLAAQVSTP